MSLLVLLTLLTGEPAPVPQVCFTDVHDAYVCISLATSWQCETDTECEALDAE